jgi:hypothetical protein
LGYKFIQSFGIKYLPDIVPGKDEFYRSGNPGYETDKPLILGMESDSTKT